MRTLVLALSFGLSICSFAQKAIVVPFSRPEWSAPYAPVRLAGNLYYVGTYDLASYLIATPEGHILINTGLADSAPLVKANVEALGFKFSDIKILLATHAHFDHVGAMAAIQQETGAKMLVHEGDAAVLADGGNSDYLFGGKGSSFAPVKPDRVLHDQDTVVLAGMKVIALHHPGHTRGATSFLFDVKDDHGTYRVLIANMPTILEDVNLSGMPAYPEVGTDFGKTIEKMKKVKFDLWFASHASQFKLHSKHTPGAPYKPEAFRDQAGYDEAVGKLEADYEKRR